MKMGMIFLVVLGILAAVAASVLIQAMSAKRQVVQGPPDSEISIVVASRDLPAMTLLDANAVQFKKVKKSAFPAGALGDPVQVVGKVLMLPMVEGAAFTNACFPQEGSGLNLASALPAGKRALSVMMTDHTGMVGLLYPGSVVDVVVSLNRKSGQSTETVTRTLLQKVQVLAVGQENIASADSAKPSDPSKKATAPRGDSRMVTLLVDPQQAQALQVAILSGTTTLTMRNPMDQESFAIQDTRLRDLAGMAIDGESAKAAAASVGNAIAGILRGISEKAAVISKDPQVEVSAKAMAPATRPTWDTLIIRGSKSEVRSFPMPVKNEIESVSAGVEANH